MKLWPIIPKEKLKQLAVEAVRDGLYIAMALALLAALAAVFGCAPTTLDVYGSRYLGDRGSESGYEIGMGFSFDLTPEEPEPPRPALVTPRYESWPGIEPHQYGIEAVQTNVQVDYGQ